MNDRRVREEILCLRAFQTQVVDVASAMKGVIPFPAFSSFSPVLIRLLTDWKSASKPVYRRNKQKIKSLHLCRHTVGCCSFLPAMKQATPHDLLTPMQSAWVHSHIWVDLAAVVEFDGTET
jgi:hypothetical protein